MPLIILPNQQPTLTQRNVGDFIKQIVSTNFALRHCSNPSQLFNFTLQSSNETSLDVQFRSNLYKNCIRTRYQWHIGISVCSKSFIFHLICFVRQGERSDTVVGQKNHKSENNCFCPTRGSHAPPGVTTVITHTAPCPRPAAGWLKRPGAGTARSRQERRLSASAGIYYGLIISG